MKSRTTWTVAIFLFVFADAIAMQMRGALLPSFQETFAVSEGMLGLIAPAGTVGFLLAVLAIGLLAGRIAPERALLFGVGGTALALFLLSASPTYLILLMLLFAQGTFTGIGRGIDRPILSHLYPTRRGKLFTLYSLAWALGATSGPLAVTAVLWFGDWRLAFALLALALCPLVILLWRIELPEVAKNERPISLEAVRELLRMPAIGGMSVALALTGGIEGAIFTWLPYFSLQYFDRASANLALTTFLLAYVPGRFVYSRVIERVDYLDLILLVSLLSLPLLVVTFALATGPFLFVAIFLLGFVVSGLFPVLSAFGVDTVPEYSGPVNAVATSATYVGIAVVPVVIGVLAEFYGIEVAMTSLIVLGVGLIAVSVATRAAA